MSKATTSTKMLFKSLLLQEPALDPAITSPDITRSHPKIKSLEPCEHGVFVLMDNGRSYVIPWANIRHAELLA